MTGMTVPAIQRQQSPRPATDEAARMPACRLIDPSPT